MNERNTFLTRRARRAGELLVRGEEGLLTDLLELNKIFCEPPLPEREVEAIARGAWRAARDRGPAMATTPLPPGSEEEGRTTIVLRRDSKVGVYHWREHQGVFEWRCDCDASPGMPRFLNAGDEGWEWAWGA